MKKAYSLLLAALCLGFAACSNDLTEVVAEDDNTAVVTLNTQLPSIATRADYSDGTTATYLTYAVYEKGTKTIVLQSTRKSAFNDKQATVSFSLVKGQGYDIVFWADAGADSPYTISLADRTVTVDYSNATGNNELRDAFYSHLTIEKVTGAIDETITLTRPFAQLNFGSDDLKDQVIADNYSVDNMKFVVTVPKGIPTVLDLLTDTTSGETESEITFTATGIASGKDWTSQTFPVTHATSGSTYYWVSMNYLLMTTDKSVLTENVVLTVSEGAGTVDSKEYRNLPSSIEVKVSNVPLQRNYRTNIYGSLLTNPAVFNLVIDNTYKGDTDGVTTTEDYNVVYTDPEEEEEE